MASAATDESAVLLKVGNEPDMACVVRLATAYLTVAHDTRDTVEYAARLVSALQEDARVTDAVSPSLDPDWSPQFTVYVPLDEDGAVSGVLEATRHTHVQQFSQPIAIHVRVPAKNQLKFGSEEVPSERYFVLWDGEALLVAWAQPAKKYVGTSGGHIVADILAEAADRAGAHLMVQACNPQCTYVFLHTAIRAVVDHTATTAWSISRHDDERSLMDVVVSGGDGVPDVAFDVWDRVRDSLGRFAAMKNHGRQILELEGVVRGDLDRLNRLHHERARAAHEGSFARVRAVWRYRRWRRTSRYYLARLWLGLGSMESLRRAWSDDALSFRRTSDEENLRDLFMIDSHEEAALVEQLDLALVESAVEHAGDRLSASFLAVATVGAAVGGALAAAIVTVIV